MRSTILILLVTVVSLCHSQPILPGLRGNEDLLATEIQLASEFIDFFLRLLSSEVSSRQRPVPVIPEENRSANLLSLAGRLLGGRGGGNSFSRDESAQDQRVLNYEQDINRRNQLTRVAKLFSGLL